MRLEVDEDMRALVAGIKVRAYELWRNQQCFGKP